MKRVLFRADASSTIGTGHIMRDLVLAKEFADSEIFFATRELSGNLNPLIAQEYKIEPLLTGEIDELIALIRKKAVDVLVIDHYDIDYLDELRIKEESGVKIFVVDDMYEQHECDILLNHNIYADPEKYEGLVPAHCELRCGSAYTLLRKEFHTAKVSSEKKESRPEHVFIAMGGADHVQLNIPILKALQSFNQYHIDVVTTTANESLEELHAYVENEERVTLHINSQEIAMLMQKALFAIVTPSVVLNELFFMKVPFIAIRTADNQNLMVKYLQQHAYKVLESFDKDVLEQSIHQMVDCLDTELINFTELNSDEKCMVLDWRNHKSVRCWMFDKQPIGLDEHLKYIDSLKNREDRQYFLLRLKGEYLGVIDFTNIDLSESRAELGIYVKPGRKGAGTLLMDQIIMYAFDKLQLKCLIAKVFSDNKAALALYQRFAFKMYETQPSQGKEIICMELCR